ncbi:MAG: replication protein RepA [Pseudomonadota bacterium]|nr:replication protein RepA [Pseudomonadota bacterium]
MAQSKGLKRHKQQSGGSDWTAVGATLPSVLHFEQMTPTMERLLDAGTEIRGKPEPDDAEKSFLTKYLVQVTLPHRNPGKVPAFRRTNGNITLTVQPGLSDDLQPLYPYGTVPRLLLYWITREALRQKSRKLELGDSINGFLRDLGMSAANGRGQRSDARRLRDQMERLFRARISIDVKGGDANRGGHAWQDMQVAPKGATWWDFKNPAQGCLFESWIELGEDFYQAILADPVPVDIRALAALKRSPLALDLYAWATYQTFVVTRNGKGRKVPWRGLQQQLGADYKDYDDFRKKAVAGLKKVQTVFPGLQIVEVGGGFWINPSRPAVLPRSVLL